MESKEGFIMIRVKDLSGETLLTNEFFTQLIGESIKRCYGVLGMAHSTPTDTLIGQFIKEEKVDKGVVVREEDGMLVIDLHIVIMYGLNINTIINSIKERVTYVVENTTNLKVRRINISIDDIVSEQ